MAQSKFSLDGSAPGSAFESSTRHVILPNHIMAVQEVVEVGVDTQLFQIPPGSPSPREELNDQSADAQENSLLLKCIMEDGLDPLHAFQEYEHYLFNVISGSDSDVPQDEDQLDPISLQEKEEDHDLPSPGIIPVEKLSSEEDHLIPVKFQKEEDPTEEDHDQPSRAGNIQLEDITAIEEDFSVQRDHA